MANPNDLTTFLASVSLFSGLNKRHLNQLSRRFIPRSYKTGDAIITQGKGGEGMFTIVSGKAEAVLETADGEKIVVNTFGPGDFFGEVAMLDDGPRTASVIATVETECLVLTRADFISVMHNDAEMATEIAMALARRLRRTVGTL
jgi:CRP-like cAMP-binding protein